MENGTNWNAMITNSFISGKKLPKEITEIEEGHNVIKEALNAFKRASDNLNVFKNVLSKMDVDYVTAKNSMNIEGLRKLNTEVEVRNKIINWNFELSLNALSVKGENEAEEEIKTRLEELFKLPLIK